VDEAGAATIFDENWGYSAILILIPMGVSVDVSGSVPDYADSRSLAPALYFTHTIPRRSQAS
jgi:hypothetical protein